MMKLLILILILSSGLSQNSCKRADLEPPVILLRGIDSVHVAKNSVYLEEGAIAFDKEDRDLTEEIQIEELNSGIPGKWMLDYSVSDRAGNTTTVERTVYVYRPNADYFGSYSVTSNSVYPYNMYVPATATFTASQPYGFSFNVFNTGGPVNGGINIFNGMFVVGYQPMGWGGRPIWGNGYMNLAGDSVTINYQLLNAMDDTVSFTNWYTR